MLPIKKKVFGDNIIRNRNRLLIEVFFVLHLNRYFIPKFSLTTAKIACYKV